MKLIYQTMDLYDNMLSIDIAWINEIDNAWINDFQFIICSFSLQMGRSLPTALMAAKSTAFFLLLLLAFYTPLLHGSPIKTIVVLVMENRSFNLMFGWMKKLNSKINGVNGTESNILNAADPKSKQFFFKDQAHTSTRLLLYLKK